MQVGLFIPCFMDMMFPEAAMATLELLEKHGVTVDYPEQQTCCGQPMYNSGCAKDTLATVQHFVKTFSKYDAVVSPSGSCVAMVREHYKHVIEDEACAAVSQKTYELCEFLTDVLKVEKIDAAFPHKVAFHSGCHGLRDLRLGESSERQAPTYSKPLQLLNKIQGLELMPLKRPDECCGFGGTFAVAEEAVSCAMGNDRVTDFESSGAEVVVSTDASCLLHLNGLIQRQKKPLKVMHIAQILNG